jgi:hypothetical protein
MPSLWKAISPISWEGWTVTIAFLLGMGLLRLEPDVTRRSIALALIAGAFCAIVALTWGDPESDVRPSWRQTLLSRQTLVWLGCLLLLAAACVAAGFYGYAGGYHMPVPGLHPAATRLR